MTLAASVPSSRLRAAHRGPEHAGGCYAGAAEQLGDAGGGTQVVADEPAESPEPGEREVRPTPSELARSMSWWAGTATQALGQLGGEDPALWAVLDHRSGT